MSSAACALGHDGAKLGCALTVATRLHGLRKSRTRASRRRRFDQQDIRTRFHQTARSAGRDPEAFLLPWVMSVAQMPGSEFDSLQSARYPRVADVRRKWKQHAILSGHSSVGNGWRGAFILDLVLRSGYGFLNGSGNADP